MRELTIMQGRLLPPHEGWPQCFPGSLWQEEFIRARTIGIAAIEWVYGTYAESLNPIGFADGVLQLRASCQQYSVAVQTLIAHYFLERPILGAEGLERRHREEKLTWLIARCAAAGLEQMVLPFLENSTIQPAQEQEAVRLLTHALQVARRHRLALSVETSLPPERFADLLGACPGLAVTYDCGNSAFLGYRWEDELRAYGCRITNVHIKDRRLGSGTVPLGQGDVDFPRLFAALRDLDYCGPFTLEAARGTPGGEVTWVAKQIAFVEAQWCGSLMAGAMR